MLGKGRSNQPLHMNHIGEGIAWHFVLSETTEIIDTKWHKNLNCDLSASSSGPHFENASRFMNRTYIDPIWTYIDPIYSFQQKKDIQWYIDRLRILQ